MGSLPRLVSSARRLTGIALSPMSVFVTLLLEQTKYMGIVLVDELAGRFAVTPQTIRKDLNYLSDQQLLSRVRGGALLSEGTLLLLNLNRSTPSCVTKAIDSCSSWCTVSTQSFESR